MKKLPARIAAVTTFAFALAPRVLAGPTYNVTDNRIKDASEFGQGMQAVMAYSAWLNQFTNALPAQKAFSITITKKTVFERLPANPYAQLCRTKNAAGNFSTPQPAIGQGGARNPVDPGAVGFTEADLTAISSAAIPASVLYRNQDFGAAGTLVVPATIQNRPEFWVTGGNAAAKLTIHSYSADTNDDKINGAVKNIFTHEYMHAKIHEQGIARLSLLSMRMTVPGGNMVNGVKTYASLDAMHRALNTAVAGDFSGVNTMIMKTQELFDRADLLARRTIRDMAMPGGPNRYSDANAANNLRRSTADGRFYFPPSTPDELYRCEIASNLSGDYLSLVQAYMEKWMQGDSITIGTSGPQPPPNNGPWLTVDLATLAKGYDDALKDYPAQ